MCVSLAIEEIGWICISIGAFAHEEGTLNAEGIAIKSIKLKVSLKKY